MFESSSASLRPYTQELLRSIGATLNGVDNTISLSGHTDSTRYAGASGGFQLGAVGQPGQCIPT
jgi:chemotaxis protein MotB